MNSPESGESRQKKDRGPNFEKNLRPATSTRATFALGDAALAQADRLARIATTYKPGGVSRSAVIRGLLRFAEEAALRSGDAAVAAVYASSPTDLKISANAKVSTADDERIWHAIRDGLIKG